MNVTYTSPKTPEERAEIRAAWEDWHKENGLDLDDFELRFEPLGVACRRLVRGG